MVSGGNTRVNMNASVASQSGKAFAKMGEDLASVGIQVSGIFEKAAKVHEEGEMIKLQQELDEMYAGYDKQMLETPNDVMKWREGWDKLTAKKQLELDGRDMSNSLRQQVNAYAGANFSKRGISISGNQTRTVIGNTQKSARVRMNHLKEEKRFDELRSFITGVETAGTLPKWELEQESLHVDRLETDHQLNQKLEAEPELFIEEAEAGKYDDLVSQPVLDAKKSKAKRLVQVSRRDDVVKYKGGIDGDLYPKEQDLKDKMEADKVDPTSQRFLLRYHKEKNREDYIQFHATPEQVAVNTSKARILLSKYRVDGTPQSESEAEMRILLDRIPDSAEKKVLYADFEKARDGNKAEIKRYEDSGRDTVNRLFKRRIDNYTKSRPKTVEKTRDEFVNDGFFTTRNLSAYFDEDQVEEILEAKEKVGHKRIVTIDAQTKMFKKLWISAKRSGQTKWQEEMGYSLAYGSGKDILGRYDDKEAGEEWEAGLEKLHMEHGNRLGDLNKLYATEKNINQQTINEHISETDLMEQSGGSTDTKEVVPAEKTPVSLYEQRFLNDYAKFAKENNLNPDPDNLLHYYDYRGAWEDGQLKTDADGHMSSRYKKAGHPRTYVSPDGTEFSSRPKRGFIDTRLTGDIKDGDELLPTKGLIK